MYAPVKCLVVVFLGCSLLATRAVAADDSTKPVKRKVIVNGSATVTAKADSALLTFGVTTSNDVAKTAREENDKQVKRLRDALTALEIKALDVQVVPTSIGVVQNFDPRLAAPGPAPGKQVQSVFQVTVREKDPEKLRSLVTKLADAAAENGGTALDSDDLSAFRPIRRRGLVDSSGPKIEWLAEEVGAARRLAIKKAVGDAQASAQAAVGDAKLEVVEIRILTDSESRRALRATTTTGSDPSIPVRVEVEVTYTY